MTIVQTCRGQSTPLRLLDTQSTVLVPYQIVDLQAKWNYVQYNSLCICIMGISMKYQLWYSIHLTVELSELLILYFYLNEGYTIKLEFKTLHSVWTCTSRLNLFRLVEQKAMFFQIDQFPSFKWILLAMLFRDEKQGLKSLDSF